MATTEVVYSPLSWEAPFLDALRRSANVSASARHAGISRKTAYQRRAEVSEFAEAWDDALEEACDYLEQVAWRRATVGDERPVLYRGRPVQVNGQPLVERTPDSRILMFLLKAHRPYKYRERYEVRVNDPMAMLVELLGMDREQVRMAARGVALLREGIEGV